MKEEKTYSIAIIFTALFSILATLCVLGLNCLFITNRTYPPTIFSLEYYIYYFIGTFIFIWIITRQENNEMFQKTTIKSIEHKVD
jgi:hypothetical protein